MDLFSPNILDVNKLQEYLGLSASKIEAKLAVEIKDVIDRSNARRQVYCFLINNNNKNVRNE